MPPHAAQSALAVELRDIVKRFPGVLACDRACLQVTRGEIHAVVGENGAGKSTLLSLVAGLYRPDEGQMWIEGQRVLSMSPREAAARGIAMVHQHFSLVPTLRVVDNILLGQQRPWWLSSSVVADCAERIAALSQQHGLPIDPLRRVDALSVAEQQRVEIIKALYRDARILILDEPTAVLTPTEADQLRAALHALRVAGRTLIYVSHKLDEVFALADRITVLRKGRTVQSAVPIAATDASAVAAEIIGPQAVAATQTQKSAGAAPDAAAPAAGAQPVLSLQDVYAIGARGSDALCGLSLQIDRGEVYGIAGVSGNGQSELCDVLCGVRPLRAGSIQLNGHSVSQLSIAQRRARGLACVPEDRYAQGCAPSLSVVDNVLLTHLDAAELSACGRWLLSPAAIRRFVARVLAPLQLPDAMVRQNPAAGSLSGGTLQKLILARELAHHPTLLIAAYPCRGLDVGATQTVHHLLRQARDQGCAILVLSEQIEELLTLCDRVGALVRGRIAGEVALSDRAARPSAPLCTPSVALGRLGRLISGLSAVSPALEAP